MDVGHAQRSPGSCWETQAIRASAEEAARELEERRKNAVDKEFMHEKEEKKKLEKWIAMLCICMCMMIITAVCSKFFCVDYFTIDRYQWTVVQAWCNQSAAINQSLKNTNNTHKFTHSITHIEQLHAVQSEWVSERWITSSSYDEVYII